MATRPLGRTGLDVTALSFGGASIGNLYQAVTNQAAHETLQAAWDAGIRFFDTAPRYGHGLSERRLGDFLRDKPRDSYVLSTKVGRILTPLRGRVMGDYGFVDVLPFEQEYDYSYDGIMRSHEASLHRLGLDRIDVLYMHDIGTDTHGEAQNAEYEPVAFSGGLKAMQELRAAGDVKAIGLGVNEVEVCLRALDHADLDAFLLAGRFTLLEQEAARPLIAACLARGASLVIGGVFNSGILATGPVPGAHYNYAEPPAEIVERVRRLQAVCARHDVPLAAAAQRFPLSNPAVASVLLGVSNKRNLDRNLASMDVVIPDALWADLVAEGLLAADLAPR
ncbi:aldo/keto reductase [Kaistia dalseonensis]|uniref:aldo/keto reductase n=1 Tax=Kaistia dalseonensis TaxID=410840 RepID=UPI002255F4CD|nr:aldo/keto reductase [Kaistia dalseonensis]MCX5493321.1 aldo/keto reductase [Kaistia dalseonensis]